MVIIKGRQNCDKKPTTTSRFIELGRDLAADIPCRDGEVFFSKWGPTFIYIHDFSSLTLPRPLNLLEKEVPLVPLSATSFQRQVPVMPIMDTNPSPVQEP